MKLNIKKAELHISFFFAAGVTVMLVLDDSGVAAMTLAACFAHECGHLGCLLLCGETPARVSLAVFGMRIDRARGLSLSLLQEAAVSAAGPLMNLLLALLTLTLWLGGHPALRIPCGINLALALFHSLPIEPLDGSRILYYLLCRRRDEPAAARSVTLLSYALSVPLILCGVFVLVKSGYNFTLLAVGGYLFLMLVLKKG